VAKCASRIFCGNTTAKQWSSGVSAQAGKRSGDGEGRRFVLLFRRLLLLPGTIERTFVNDGGEVLCGVPRDLLAGYCHSCRGLVVPVAPFRRADFSAADRLNTSLKLLKFYVDSLAGMVFMHGTLKCRI
jgi:hypothetical protein